MIPLINKDPLCGPPAPAFLGGGSSCHAVHLSALQALSASEDTLAGTDYSLFCDHNCLSLPFLPYLLSLSASSPLSPSHPSHFSPFSPFSLLSPFPPLSARPFLSPPLSLASFLQQASPNVTSPFSRVLPDAVVRILHEPFKRQVGGRMMACSRHPEP